MTVQPGGSDQSGQSADPVQRQAVVTGDLTIDWHISRPGPIGEGDAWSPSRPTRARGRAGGAALAADLLRALTIPDWTVNTSIVVPATLQSDDRRLHHSYALWSPFPRQRSGSGHDRVWRVDEFLGLEQASVAGVQPDRGPDTADLVVLDDAALGFRDDPAGWPVVLANGQSSPWVILKMARPVAAGRLWEALVGSRSHRLIVVLTANDLRLNEVQISRELSWERTAQDLYRELVENWTVNALSRCAHVVVSFGSDGALHLAADGKRRPRATLYFDPAGIEGEWRLAYPGRMIGYTTCLVGGLARQVMLNPASPAIGAGIQHGVAAARELHLSGYGPDQGNSDEGELCFPAGRIARMLASEPTPCAEAAVRYPEPRDVTGSWRTWTILADQYPSGLDGLAEQIVLDGSQPTLRNAPQGRFGALLTVDRREIESFRALRALVLEYAGQSLQRPLSVAVFGAPGAGKSFAVKQVAAALLPGQLEELTINLSQLGGPADLHDAFHRVRDAGLKGKLPLVFWDEFDTPLAGERLGWLRHFLAPMQDGEFQQGQLVHPIGRAIFVFAGGTCHSMGAFAADLESAESRQVKLPDFVSRLKGFVDILGPNPEGSAAADPYYVLRRAIVLRAAFERLAGGLLRNDRGARRLQIDRGVLRALLRTRTYYHGARSIEAVLATSRLSDTSLFERSCLPPESQLALHVDVDDFSAFLVPTVMDENVLDKLARAVHEQYCAGLRARGYVWGSETNDEGRTSSALVPFDELPPHEQAQNRANARDIGPKLAEIGYTLTRAYPGDPLASLPDDDVERLAELEHVRWTRAKLIEGWRYGQSRADADRAHPGLLPWAVPPDQVGARYPFTAEELERLGPNALPDEQREKDRDLTRGIPSILAAADLTIRRIDPDASTEASGT